MCQSAFFARPLVGSGSAPSALSARAPCGGKISRRERKVRGGLRDVSVCVLRAAPGREWLCALCALCQSPLRRKNLTQRAQSSRRASRCVSLRSSRGPWSGVALRPLRSLPEPPAAEKSHAESAKFAEGFAAIARGERGNTRSGVALRTPRSLREAPCGGIISRRVRRERRGFALVPSAFFARPLVWSGSAASALSARAPTGGKAHAEFAKGAEAPRRYRVERAVIQGLEWLCELRALCVRFPASERNSLREIPGSKGSRRVRGGLRARCI